MQVSSTDSAVNVIYGNGMDMAFCNTVRQGISWNVNLIFVDRKFNFCG